MSSVWRHPKSPFYTGIYRDETNRWRRFATKERSWEGAKQKAASMEEIARVAREQKASRETLRAEFNAMLARLFGPETVTTTRQHLTNWLRGQQQTLSDGSGLKYGIIVERFLTFIAVKADQPLTAVDVTDCEAYKTHLHGLNLAPATIHTELSVLRGIFEAAIRQRLLTFNPARAITLPKKMRKITRRVFDAGQIQLILAQAAKENSPDWVTVILLGYYFGTRLGDSANLLWDAVDLTKGAIRYRSQKTGEENTVTLHPCLHKYLLKIAGDNTGPICPSLHSKRVSLLSDNFTDLMGRAGISCEREQTAGQRMRATLSFHSLRKTFVSEMARRGVSRELRMKIVGHTSEEAHEVYTSLELQQIREAVNVVPHVEIP